MRQMLLPFMLIFSLNSAAEQADLGSYEDQLVFQLVATRAESEVIWLGTQGKPFLGLYRQAEGGNPDRVAIILHSMGGHADWPEVIAPLRTGLPGMGWSTLSIQLPVLEPQAPIASYGGMFEQINARIRSALDYLQTRNYTEVVLVGYSFGASVAINYHTGSSSPIRALVGISMQRHIFLSPAYNLFDDLGKVTVPTLDIYGSRDFSDVLQTAEERRMLSKGNATYEQQVIEQADHYFTSYTSQLVERIAKWLDTIVPATDPLQDDTFYFL